MTSSSPDYYGQRLGLPQDGPGSLATVGRRLAAILIDWALAYGVAYLLVGDRLLKTGQFTAMSVLAVMYLVGLAISGSTLGMAALGLRVTSDQGGKASPYAVGMRTVLLFLFIPAVIWDADGRGLHDRVAHTMIVTTR
ncbi:MAG: RDD family protein [Catenulispora sp.]|nr:RDD family protein [Catenulispora sp.]